MNRAPEDEVLQLSFVEFGLDGYAIHETPSEKEAEIIWYSSCRVCLLFLDFDRSLQNELILIFKYELP